MSLPALRALKANLPDAAITLVTRGHLVDVFDHIEAIDRVVAIPAGSGVKSLGRSIALLRGHGFERGLLFTNSFHSALLFRLAGIKKTTGYLKDLRGPLLHCKAAYPTDDRHHIYFYQDLVYHMLRHMGISPPPGPGSHYSTAPVITGDERDRLSSYLSSLGVDMGRPLVGISAAAAYGAAKMWPAERFSALIRRLRGAPSPEWGDVLLFGSEKERDAIARIVAGATGAGDDTVGGHVHNLAGRLTLRQTMTALSLCGSFVGNDSGLMHIASSLGVPSVVLFGPTRFDKTGPLGRHSRVVHHPVDCAPCLHRECPLDHRCMTAITVDEVLATLGELRDTGHPEEQTQ